MVAMLPAAETWAVGCFYGPLATARKRTRFALAQVARFDGPFADRRVRSAVELAVGYADGAGTRADLATAVRLAEAAAADFRTRAAGSVWSLAEGRRAAEAAVGWRSARAVADALGWAAGRPDCDPFTLPPPPAVDPVWLTDTVRAIAWGIDRDGAFDRLPILADALEDAGCDNPVILSHCRDEGPHVRGCWVIDLIAERD